MKRFSLKLTAITDPEREPKIVLTLAHIFKISPDQARARLANPPIVLMKKASETQVDKLLKIFRGLGADVIIEEEGDDEGFVSSVSTTNTNLNPSSKAKIPGKASSDAKLSLSTIVLMSLITFVCLGVGGYYVFSKPKSKSVKAQEFIRKGKYQEAHDLLNKKVLKGQATAGEHIQTAMVLIMMARQEQDSIGWRDFGKKGLDSVPVRGEDLLQTPLANRALMMAKLGIERFPDEPELHRWAGFIYQTKGMYEAAEEEYKRADRLNPGNIIYKNLLGNLNKEQGLFDKADYQFRSALNIDSNDVTALQNLTVLNLSHRKDTTLAMIYFRRSENKMDPSRYTLRREMAIAAYKKFNKNAYQKEPRSQVSWDYYESKRGEFNRRKKAEPEVRVELADLYAKRGMIDEAIMELNIARGAGVESRNLYSQLAQLYIAQEKPESALYILKEADNKDLTNAEILKNLSLLHRYYSENKSKANKYLKAYLAAGGDTHERDLYDAVVP